MDEFLFDVNYDNVRTEFRNNDIYRKGAPVVVKPGISEDLGVVLRKTEQEFRI